MVPLHKYHRSHTCKLQLQHNDKYKKNGARALAKAAHRYGFTEVTQGYIYSSKGPGSTVMRKLHHTAAAGSPDETEVPVTDLQGDLEYVVPVLIGTPGITLTLDFDTGSSDLWVWSTEYKGADTGHAVYNPKKSSTAQAQSGLTWSILMDIELAKTMSASFLQGGSDGLLGLAWPSINTVEKNGAAAPVATPVENMITKNLIASPLFTVKLTKGGEDGFYTFGEIDTTVTSSPIVYTPVDNSQGFWSFTSTTYTLNGQTQTLDGGTAIADTGTTLMLLPDSAVSAIYAAIPGSKLDSTQGGYVYPSSATPPTLTFAVGNTQYTLDAADIAYGEADSSGMVFGGIQSSGNLGFSIFGDVFLKSVYVVFDQGNTQIGMAQR